MECRDVRELAESFVSDQLQVETNHEVVRHLESCPACRAEIAARRELRERLRAAFINADALAPRPEFAAELSAQLRPARIGMSRRLWLQSWWAVAAGVVAAAGGTLVVRESRSRSRVAALASAAAGDHQNCAVKFNLAERPIRLEEAARRYGAPYGALATFAPPRIEVPLDIVERHACVFEGRRFGHLVLRFRGALASLLVTTGEQPGAPELEPGIAGPAVASFPAGRFVAFIVADADPPHVLALAEALARPLSQHLA